MCLREKIGPDPRNFNQRVSLGRNDLLIRTFPSEMSGYAAFFPLYISWPKASPHGFIAFASRSAWQGTGLLPPEKREKRSGKFPAMTLS
jgi:hypothetical protein